MNNMNPEEHCLDTPLEAALAWLYQAKNPCWVWCSPSFPMEVALVLLESLLHMTSKRGEFKKKVLNLIQRNAKSKNN